MFRKRVQRGTEIWIKRACIGAAGPHALGEFSLEQPLGVAGKNLAAVAVSDLKPPDRLDRRRNRAKRRVGREHHMVRPEKLEPAAHRVNAAAEQGGIAVEVVHVIEMWPLQRGKDA